jgi:hypothetical protein
MSSQHNDLVDAILEGYSSDGDSEGAHRYVRRDEDDDEYEQAYSYGEYDEEDYGLESEEENDDKKPMT